MLVYEVNLFLQKNITSEYLPWLDRHMEEMLKYNGFKKAELFEVDSDDEFDQFTVQYWVNSRESLDHYFEKYAETMRNEAKEKFGDQFTAHRRIYTLKDSILSQ